MRVVLLLVLAAAVVAQPEQRLIPGKISDVADPEVVEMEKIMSADGLQVIDEKPAEPIHYTDWVNQNEAEVPDSDEATKPVESTTTRKGNPMKTGTLQSNANSEGPCCNICPEKGDCAKESCHQTCYQLCGPFCKYDPNEGDECMIGKSCHMMQKILDMSQVAEDGEDDHPTLRGKRSGFVSFKPFDGGAPTPDSNTDDNGMEIITNFHADVRGSS